MSQRGYTARLDVPDFGEGSMALEVAAWHVAEGQQVRAGQAVVSLRSGRSMIKLPSPHSGKVVTLYVNTRDTVGVGSALAEIELEPDATGPGAEPATQQRGLDAGRGEDISMSSNNRDRLDAGASAAARAAPAVRSLAKKLGVDLEKCVGTGRDGTITMNDVIARTNQVKASRADKAPPARPAQSPQPGRRASPEPVSAAPQPAAPVARPVSAPAPNPRSWAPANQPPASAPVPREPVRAAQPRPQPPVPAQTWATMEEDPPEQPEPRVVASRLQDLSSYDFPSAERQPTAPQEAPNGTYAPQTSWFATEETTTSYQATMVPVQPDPPPSEPFQMLNPWGAVEEQEQREQSVEQAAEEEQYDASYVAEDAAVEAAEEPQIEEYELADAEPSPAEDSAQTAEQDVDADWGPSLATEEVEEEQVAEEALADELTQYESDAEGQDAAEMTTVYEAPASQVATDSDLASDEDWTKPVPPTPETPAEWAQPELATYANTASAGAEARPLPLRTPYLDMTPRTLIDQEDRLHGQRRNMALNMTRARDEVATCTMFDDADLNAWSNFSDITVRLLRAIVAGIHAEPGFNATFDPAGPSRRLLRQINVAVSVDTREGLTVPVLRDIGSRSLEDLREYVYHMKERTLSRSLAPEDLRDFTFSLANYGIFAGRYATPLVIPPTVATLGCGRLERAVVAGESVPEIHALLPLSLTFDHRCVTMGEACRFLAALKRDLELAQ